MAVLNHLHLHVTEMARSQSFYERWFGFRHQVDHGEIRFLRDDAGLDLALAPAAKVEALPRWFHFGFRLGDPQSVRAMLRDMQTNGIKVRNLCDEPDLVSFRCSDPDGYAIEVYWE